MEKPQEPKIHHKLVVRTVFLLFALAVLILVLAVLAAPSC